MIWVSRRGLGEGKKSEYNKATGNFFNVWQKGQITDLRQGRPFHQKS